MHHSPERSYKKVQRRDEEYIDSYLQIPSWVKAEIDTLSFTIHEPEYPSTNSPIYEVGYTLRPPGEKGTRRFFSYDPQEIRMRMIEDFMRAKGTALTFSNSPIQCPFIVEYYNGWRDMWVFDSMQPCLEDASIEAEKLQAECTENGITHYYYRVRDSRTGEVKWPV